MTVNSSSSPPSPSVQIAVIGDIHNHWTPVDAQLLQALAVDLVLFVGDVGNEAVDLVRSIVALPLPKAVILGNHDAWYTMTDWGRKKRPYDPKVEDWVQEQLNCLGETHVGYGYLDFPDLNLSVVGSRPFSWGGPKWRNRKFYRSRFGVNNFQDSTALIVAAGTQARGDRLILIGHCGPTGLGDAAEDPCGRDWNPIGGDQGDPDFAAAIDQLQSQGKTIPLVAFGHMHHNLRHTQTRLRRMEVTNPDTGTLFLNAARTPRIQTLDDQTCHHFALVELTGDRVTRSRQVWVTESGQAWDADLVQPRATAKAFN
ncbi:MAG: TIGR04168 family protein [Prochlorothrix sp.]